MKHAFAMLLLLSSPVLAEDMEDGGTLNPEEMSINRVLENAARGEVDMSSCASGYFITKAGRHVQARQVFEACAAAGYTGAMHWMSQLDNNGLGGDYDPDSAAEWDKRAADLGDPVGKFNYGLDLMRGHGVPQDEALGRSYVDEAAEDGLLIAKRLQGANYDLDEVTPDADDWKYAPLF